MSVIILQYKKSIKINSLFDNISYFFTYILKNEINTLLFIFII